MYYSLKTDCYYRKYGSIGYIARPILSVEEIVDESGALFLEELKYEPRHIDEIVKSICEKFESAEVEKIKIDAQQFFDSFLEDGFLNGNEDLDDYTREGFTYSTLDGKLAYTSLKPQLEETSSHFLREYFKKNPFLHTFHIEITSRCNERCVHCYIPHESKNSDIDYDMMMDVLNQCKEMNVMTIVFSGGEPMLHPHFCDFLRYAKDLDFNVTILSNLTCINKEIMEALTYKHASCVNVSLYSMIPEVHDRITTINGSHEKTIENIKRLIDANIPIQINCPVMKQNKDSFHEVVNWGQDNKCTVNTDYLIMARSDGSTDNLDNRLSYDDLQGVIEKFLSNDIVVKTNVENATFNEEVLEDDPEDRVCGVGITTLCMIANGDIYPCAGWQRYVCGNIKEESLRSIWEDSDEVNYLRSLKQKDFKKCLGCADKEFCLMCMSRNSNENDTGDIFDIPQITCDAAYIHHQLALKLKENRTL